MSADGDIHKVKFFIDPGGKIEPGETAEQALTRELAAECYQNSNSKTLSISSP